RSRARRRADPSSRSPRRTRQARPPRRRPRRCRPLSAARSRPRRSRGGRLRSRSSLGPRGETAEEAYESFSGKIEALASPFAVGDLELPLGNGASVHRWIDLGFPAERVDLGGGDAQPAVFGGDLELEVLSLVPAGQRRKLGNRKVPFGDPRRAQTEALEYVPDRRAAAARVRECRDGD